VNPPDPNSPGDGIPVTYRRLDGDPILEIREEERYFRIRYLDVIDYPKQIRLVDIIVALYAETKKRFLIDTRGCEARYSFMDRFEVAKHLAEKMRIGIVAAYIIDKELNLGIVEPAANNRGAAGLRIVTTEDAALEWIERA
jgi:hypothetical protein